MRVTPCSGKSPWQTPHTVEPSQSVVL